MIHKVFYCIDGHTCGNPVRLVAGGGPLLRGAGMFERRAHFMEEFDWIRRGLMFEPRGHDMMSGSILYPPSDPENDIGILFIETSGCLPMCGHGTIGTVTMAIEHGLIAPKVPGTIRIETPAGLVIATYQSDERHVTSVKIVNVPSFLHSRDLVVQSPVLGKIRFDVAYGGNFYAIIDPQENYSGLDQYKVNELISFSPLLRELINSKYRFVHPENPEIEGVSHIMWTGEPTQPSSTARNAVFYGYKAIDRSPCGTGTSARMAQWAARQKLQKGEKFVHESVIGSQFIGQIEEITTCGPYPAIIPSITGWAKITGQNTILIDEDDPYAFGFQVI